MVFYDFRFSVVINAEELESASVGIFSFRARSHNKIDYIKGLRVIEKN